MFGHSCGTVRNDCQKSCMLRPHAGIFHLCRWFTQWDTVEWSFSRFGLRLQTADIGDRKTTIKLIGIDNPRRQCAFLYDLMWTAIMVYW